METKEVNVSGVCVDLCMYDICVDTVPTVLLSMCVCVSDARERGTCEPPEPGCGGFASHAGLPEENPGSEGETHRAAGPGQCTAPRKPDLAAEQSR